MTNLNFSFLNVPSGLGVGEWVGGFSYVTRFRVVHENNVVVFGIFLFLEICLMN